VLRRWLGSAAIVVLLALGAGGAGHHYRTTPRADDTSAQFEKSGPPVVSGPQDMYGVQDMYRDMYGPPAVHPDAS